MAMHIALHEVGVPFEAKLTPFCEGAHKRPEYLAINPEGKVPTLVIDGRPLIEVEATFVVSGTELPGGRAPAAIRRHRGGGARHLVDVV